MMDSDYASPADEERAEALEASALHHIGSYWLTIKDAKPVVFKRTGTRGKWAWERQDGLDGLTRSERERRVQWEFRESFREWEVAKRELEGGQ